MDHQQESAENGWITIGGELGPEGRAAQDRGFQFPPRNLVQVRNKNPCTQLSSNNPLIHVTNEEGGW